jgi:hypothetical protein
MQVNVKTVIVVVLLSALVWVFAERAVIKTAVVEVEISLFSNNPEYIVQYLNEQNEPLTPTSQRVKVQVKGPAGMIQSLKEGKLTPRIVRTDIETRGYTNLGHQDYEDFTPSVLDILDGKVTFHELDAYLEAEEAESTNLRVRVTRLLPVSLPIQVKDENNIPLPQERIETLEPEQVQAYVAGGTTNPVVVTLTAAQLQKATQEIVSVNAPIPGLSHPKEVKIKIKLVEETTIWPVEKIERVKVGILKPASMEGKYRVIPIDLDTKLELKFSSISFQGPPAAVEAYKNATWHLVLEVKEEDIDTTNPARPLRYNLPKGQQQIIIIKPVNESVRFRVEKIDE